MGQDCWHAGDSATHAGVSIEIDWTTRGRNRSACLTREPESSAWMKCSLPTLCALERVVGWIWTENRMNTQRSLLTVPNIKQIVWNIVWHWKSIPIKSNQVVEDCTELTRNSITWHLGPVGQIARPRLQHVSHIRGPDVWQVWQHEATKSTGSAEVLALDQILCFVFLSWNWAVTTNTPKLTHTLASELLMCSSSGEPVPKLWQQIACKRSERDLQRRRANGMVSPWPICLLLACFIMMFASCAMVCFLMLLDCSSCISLVVPSSFHLVSRRVTVSWLARSDEPMWHEQKWRRDHPMLREWSSGHEGVRVSPILYKWR